MAIRLGDHLVYGELNNTGNYSTHGVLVLRGEDPEEDFPLYVELTGNCDDDLKGKHFRFCPGEDSLEPTVVPDEMMERLQAGQVGPTGSMTAQGWVRALPCSVKEFVHRSRLGEPPPTKWTRHLYLEWYSQNGRVVIELAGADVEECVREPVDEEDDGEWVDIPNLALPPACVTGEASDMPDITVVRREGDGYSVEKWSPGDLSEESDSAFADEETDDLQRALEAESRALDRSLREGEFTVSDASTLPEDWVPGEGEPIKGLLSDLDKLPDPDDLGDSEVEILLKDLLAQMAMIGVALDVCPHFTPRDSYRLLRDTIFPEDSIDIKLVENGYVQHYLTHEYCSECEAEIEAMGPPDDDFEPDDAL